ncbi:MAG: hypothetical protein QM610_10090 [Chitinophagaceae bacterium]
MRQYIFHIIFFTTAFASSLSPYAQNISGEKVDVSSLALTVLKFNSKITHYEFDDKQNYSGQVRNSDNTFVIRVAGDAPTNTNLYLSEGKRGHWFTLNYIGENIDLNRVKLFQDFSDLKYVKKLVEQEQRQQGENLARTTTTTETVGDKEKEKQEEDIAQKKKEEELEKKKKEIVENAQRDSIAFQKVEQERLAQLEEKKKQEQKQKEIEQAKRAQFVADSIQAEKAEQERIAQAKAEELRHEQELAAQAKRNKFIIDSIKAEQVKQERLAKLEAQKQKAREEVERRKIQNDSIARAWKAEQERIAFAKAEKAKQEQALLEQAKREQHVLDSVKAQKIAQEKLAKLKEKEWKDAQVKRRMDSLAALPKEYTAAELWRKYPKVVFGQPPGGQSFSSDYFLQKDTLQNYTVSSYILNDLVADDALPTPIHSNVQDQASFVLKSINFSGVNCYMRIHLSNNSPKQDYLVGPVDMTWEQKEGKNYHLYPCYITAFPVLSPHAEKDIVLVTRAINVKDEDIIRLNIGDRLDNIELEITFPGKLYNEQYNIIRELKEE